MSKDGIGGWDLVVIMVTILMASIIGIHVGYYNGKHVGQRTPLPYTVSTNTLIITNFVNTAN